jgi:hypothetical protein
MTTMTMAMERINNKTEKLIKEYLILCFDELNDDQLDDIKNGNYDTKYNFISEIFENCPIFLQNLSRDYSYSYNNIESNFYEYVKNNYDGFDKDFIYILQYVVMEFKEEYDTIIDIEDYTDFVYIIDSYGWLLTFNVFDEILKSYEKPAEKNMLK